jgi:hypothetical protein
MIAARVRVTAEEYGVCGKYAAQRLALDIFRAMIAAHEEDGK